MQCILVLEVPSLVPRLSLFPPTESLGTSFTEFYGGSILLYAVCRVSYRILSWRGGGELYDSSMRVY